MKHNKSCDHIKKDVYLYNKFRTYCWVIVKSCIQALGARLEEMVHEDKQHVANIVSMVTEECRQKELLMEDEEEDFLDEG